MISTQNSVCKPISDLVMACGSCENSGDLSPPRGDARLAAADWTGRKKDRNGEPEFARGRVGDRVRVDVVHERLETCNCLNGV